MPEHSITEAQTKFNTACNALEHALACRAIRFRVTSSTRTFEHQSLIYSYGRTRKGHIITYAKPGHSPHNYGLARDYALFINGKPIWDTTHYFWQCFARLAREVGLVWGGDFKKIHDACHVEHKQWRYHAKKKGWMGL